MSYYQLLNFIKDQESWFHYFGEAFPDYKSRLRELDELRKEKYKRLKQRAKLRNKKLT